MSIEHVVVARDGNILRVQFNRPDKKNAITAAMYGSIAAALTQADRDPAIRVVFLTGTADCFTSGNDLNDFLKNPPQGDDSPVARFLAAITQAAKPIVAAVNGVAVGVGTTMLLHCDLVYAGAGALSHALRQSRPMPRGGIEPDSAGANRSPARRGAAHAGRSL